MRSVIVVLHRWLGLGSALFLLVTALTGALLPWQHELDAWLNPTLFKATATGTPMPALELARRIEAAHPGLRVTYMTLSVTPGEAQVFAVEPHGDTPAPGFDEVFMDPVTGVELGTREWGRLWPLGRDNLLAFIYVLHYSLHLPGTWGTWLLGGVAVIWLLDCFAGLYLTFPARQRSDPALAPVRGSWWRRWQPAWCIRRVGGFRLQFDLHRAGGLWAWILLLMLAFTSVALNLYSEVFYPALSRVATVTPSPYELREPGPAYRALDPAAGFAEILARADQEAAQRGWSLPAGDIFYARSYGFYRLKFFDAAHPHGDSALGPALLFYDGQDGSLLGAIEPGVGTAADLVIQAQFPLHSGNILGLWGRILITLAGLVICVLVVTGVLIWLRKRTARGLRREQEEQTAGQ